MSGSPYIGPLRQHLREGAGAVDPPRDGQGRADQLRRAGRPVAQPRHPRRPRALPLRRARQAILRRARQGRLPSACSTRWSASTCRTSSSRCAAGSRATSCPTPIAAGASSSPAMPPISITPPRASASTPGSATPSISAGSSTPRCAGWGGSGAARQLRDRAPAGRPPQHRPCRREPRRRPRARAAAGRFSRTRRRASARAARWATPSSSSMTRKFITDGLALGYRYDPSPICLERGRRRAARLDRGLSPERRDRQPRAARLARRRPLDHRPLRPRLYADALRRRRARRVRDRTRIRERAASR